MWIAWSFLEEDHLLNEGFDLSQEGWRFEQVEELDFISSSTFGAFLLRFEVKGVFLVGFNIEVLVNGLYKVY